MYFHLYNKRRCFWRNLHRWQRFYAAAGSDGMDKSHLWWIFVLFTNKIWQLQAACLRINQCTKRDLFRQESVETCCIFPFLDFLFGAKNKKGGSWYLWDIFLVEFLYKLHLVILIGFHLLWFSQRFVHLFSFISTSNFPAIYHYFWLSYVFLLNCLLSNMYH